jgi:hypothetical protein
MGNGGILNSQTGFPECFIVCDLNKWRDVQGQFTYDRNRMLDSASETLKDETPSLTERTLDLNCSLRDLL